MPIQQPTIDDCIESVRLHVRTLQRAGIKFDTAGRHPGPSNRHSHAARLALVREQSTGCKRCHLCKSRTNVVFGEGNSEARLMFVGGAPDREADAQGRCFAGQSGQLLTRIIEAINLQRDQVYLTNVVKCLVPQGDPGDDSIEACMPFLQQQIEIIQPDIICTLGPAAARALHAPGLTGEPPRGTLYRRGPMLVMPTHHPEMLLRRPELKSETWVDVQVIQRELASRTRSKR